jgi:hypothetical protein
VLSYPAANSGRSTRSRKPPARPVLCDTGQIVEDEQVEANDGGFEPKIARGDLQILHQIGGSGEQNPIALPPPGDPNNRTLAPLPSHASPATNAMPCALAQAEGRTHNNNSRADR